MGPLRVICFSYVFLLAINILRHEWKKKMILSLLDEDRLSKRKSIGETISLQVEVESRNSPEKEEVKTRFIFTGVKPIVSSILVHLFVPIVTPSD